MVRISTWIPHRRENSIMAYLTYLKDTLIDFIWPHLTGCPERKPESNGLKYYLPPELITDTKNMLIIRMTQSEERSEAVDRKLLSLFRTGSLLATVAIAVFIGAVNLQSVDDNIYVPIVCIIMAIILYIFLQLCFVVSTTIKGLRAKGYRRLGRESLIPKKSDTFDDFRRSQIEDIIHIIEQNEWTTNRKVDCIELAYTALSNVLYGLVVLMVVALILAINILM